MIHLENIEPLAGEIPSAYAVRLSEAFQADEDADWSYTPWEVARRMASVSEIKNRVFQMLEPGCGTAILSCAHLEHWAEQENKPINVQLTVYESDFTLLALAEKALRYLKSWLQNRKIHFDYKLIAGDFVLKNEQVLRGSLFAEEKQTFDMIVAFPPQKRISALDNWGQAVHPVGYSLPDLYAVFLNISLQLLKPKNGCLNFILPRKFAFSPLLKDFRMHFFRQMVLQHAILLDDAMSNHFVMKAERRSVENSIQFVKLEDEKTDTPLQWSFWDLFNLHTQNKVLTLPANIQQDKIFRLAKSWKQRLQDMHLTLGSGKIENAHLKNKETKNGPVAFLPFGKSKEWLAVNDFREDAVRYSNLPDKLVVPNQSYILIKTKAAKKSVKIYASLYQPAKLKAEALALSKNTLFISLPSKKYSDHETWGLLAYLNSKWLSAYLQSMKGNQSLSSGEWKELPFPDRKSLAKIGKSCLSAKEVTRLHMSKCVDEVLSEN